MPQMIGVRPPGDRGNAHAGVAQSQPQVVIFASPAAEVFVVAVDPLVIGAGDAEISAEELGPGWAAEERVNRCAGMPPAHLEFLERRDLLQVAPAANVVFGDLLGDGLVKVNRITSEAEAAWAAREMYADMVGR